jgi:hypothetical protein
VRASADDAFVLPSSVTGRPLAALFAIPAIVVLLGFPVRADEPIIMGGQASVGVDGVIRFGADSDDPPIVLGEEATVAPDGTLHFSGGKEFTPSGGLYGEFPTGKEFRNDDDDPIIIIEEEVPLVPSTSASAGGPLGRLWESLHIGAELSAFSSAQAVDPNDGVGRVLGDAFVEGWLLPTEKLTFEATAIARVAIDSTPAGKVTWIADWYEAVAKINVNNAATVRLGRLVVPWGKTRGSAFGDRLNPVDQRRGSPFPEPARSKQPQWGAQAKGSLGPVGLDGVFWLGHDPSEGSLAAANQGGVHIGRYQTALIRSPSRAAGWLHQEDVSTLYIDQTLGAFSVAGRAAGRVGSVDVSASLALGYDDTPSLQLAPEAKRTLVAEALPALGHAVGGAPPAPCASNAALRCMGIPGTTLVPTRRASMSLDASYSVIGLAIVRAELLAVPHVGDVGKTAWLVDGDGLRSINVTQLAAALAIEGQLGDAIDASLEVFNVSWAGIPAQANLWGVEPFHAASDGNSDRVVSRLAGAAVLGGTLFEDRLRWRLRGEAGVLAADVLMSAELRYALPIWNLYVGGRGDVFAGVPGTPGWMRQDASLLGVYLGEGA